MKHTEVGPDLLQVQTVLVSHRVVDARSRAHDVTWATFRGLLDTLSRTETTSALTFDDATDDHLRVAEELSERGISAIFFVPTEKIGEPGHLDAAQVARVAALGHAVGAHSHSHVPLSRLSAPELRREVELSCNRLTALVETTVRWFAPPGGSWHLLLAGELIRAGFEASRSMRWGIREQDVDRWRIPVVPVTELTVARGWVARSVIDRRLPLSMQCLRTAKRVVPARVAMFGRDALFVPSGVAR
jgi:peptidoglycan/xylan/chitin deacetylase (PgdA/CDA1 family)